ncbi:MAG TPA: patatin-like phospholipase family protein [Candidatus Binatia bacterium]|nr:patatin-like phospholipase family protein [Candidatus Binatia bacterium]
MRVFGALFVLLGCLWLTAADARPVERKTLRVALTAFAAPSSADVEHEPRLRQLRQVLMQLAAMSTESDRFGATLSFELSVGNYYQTYEWLRDRVVDAAVVSPLVAALLEDENRAGEEPVFRHLFEFCVKPEGTPLRCVGHPPEIRALQGARTPRAIYDRCLERFFARAIRPGSRNVPGCRLFMVNHLSTSGYLVPTLYARAALERLLDGHLRKRPRARARADAIRTEIRTAFWRQYDAHVRFSVAHESKREHPEAGDVLFTVEGFAKPLRRRTEVERYTQDPAEPQYFLPNDVLVFRSDAVPAREALNGDVAAEIVRRLPKGQPPLPDGMVAFPPSDPAQSPAGYFAVGAYNRVSHAEFKNSLLRQAQADPQLVERFDGAGPYEFSLREAVDLIRVEQQDTGDARLALVLPGGGVKSAYQAGILDFLYGQRLLRNESDPGDEHDKGGLREVAVSAIVGTSGGALTGLFAASIDSAQLGRGFELKQSWLRKGVILAEGSKIFGSWDSPRWASFLLVVAILSLVLAAAPRATRPSLPASPRRSAALLLALFALTPFVLATVHRIGPAAGNVAMLVKATVVPDYLVSGSYGVTCLFVYYCLVLPLASPSPKPWRSIAVRAVIVMIAGAIAGWLAPSYRLHVAAATLFAVTSLVAHYRSWLRWDRGVFLDTLKGLVAVALVIGVSYAVLQLPVRLGETSVLETDYPSFWLYLIASAVVASLVLFGLGRVSATVQSAVCYLNGEHIFVWKPWRRISTLLLLHSVALVAWSVALSPGVYQNRSAYLFFKDRVADALADPIRLATSLVVPVCHLGPALLPGFVEERPEGCVYIRFGTGGSADEHPDREEPIIPIPADRERLQDVVFASGAAFPIFAPRQMTQRDFQANLIDGGYGHNVPIEAARRVGARQVLLLSSEPRPEPTIPRKGYRPPAPVSVPPPAGCEPYVHDSTLGPVWTRVRALWSRAPSLHVGDLAAGVSKLFSFMFARAQRLDARSRSDMLVVSVAPTKDGDRPFPSLAQFTPTNVCRLLRCAEVDIREDSRPALVESWGTPKIVDHVDFRGPVQPDGGAPKRRR